MKISGFSFIRNGVVNGYPFLESYASVLPLVDEFVVVVGKSDDSTLSEMQKFAAQNPKVRILESVWDENLRQGGKILAQQTNLAMHACRHNWGLYIQSDEVLHEQDYPAIRKTLVEADENDQVDGLLFRYLHFYGSFSVINMNPSQYRHEVRLVRLDRGIVSYGDAQGFRKPSGESDLVKIQVLPVDATVYHYGWVRPQKTMQRKTEAMDRLYHENPGATGDNYRYRNIYGLERFTGTHPSVMQKAIAAADWQVDVMTQPMHFHWKDIRKVISRNIEKATGWLPFSYRNYKRL